MPKELHGSRYLKWLLENVARINAARASDPSIPEPPDWAAIAVFIRDRLHYLDLDETLEIGRAHV